MGRALLLVAAVLAQSQAVFRSETTLVRIDAEVVDGSGQPVETLAKEDFLMFDGGRPQELLHFSHQEEPLDVILLFDTSLSMKPMGGFAEETGGDATTFDDAGAGLRRMLHRLRLRYSLAYAMPAWNAGERRRIDVRLARETARRLPRARVRARAGYIVPEQNQL